MDDRTEGAGVPGGMLLVGFLAAGASGMLVGAGLVALVWWLSR